MSQKAEKVLAKNLQASFKHVIQVLLPFLDYVLYLLIFPHLLFLFLSTPSLIVSTSEEPQLRKKKLLVTPVLLSLLGLIFTPVLFR